MFRQRVINFLEAALVLLTLTNALSIAAAAYAISLARGGIPPKSSTAKSSSRCSFFFWHRLRTKAQSHGARP
jgi:hypothetical protein